MFEYIVVYHDELSLTGLINRVQSKAKVVFLK